MVLFLVWLDGFPKGLEVEFIVVTYVQANHKRDHIGTGEASLTGDEKFVTQTSTPAIRISVANDH